MSTVPLLYVRQFFKEPASSLHPLNNRSKKFDNLFFTSYHRRTCEISGSQSLENYNYLLKNRKMFLSNRLENIHYNFKVGN